VSYSIEIDKEITIDSKTYSVFIEADLDYSYPEDPEPTGVEITKAEIAPLDGEPLHLVYMVQRLEKVTVYGYPELTEAIDTLLWDRIQIHTEDNYQDLIRDLSEDERDL